MFPPAPVMSAATTPKILVIRGGAIGDFLLTLPAIQLLREAFPNVRLEILGYEHIVTLAEGGGLADATRSIEYSAMAGFFNPKAELDAELCEYFTGFQQVVSYLYDPDGFFAGNLRRAGVRQLLEASPKIDPEADHATRQLARPLECLALFLEDPCVRLAVAAADHEFARQFLQATAPAPEPRRLVAIHPGSGGERKNWPADRWLELGRWLQSFPPSERPRLLVVGGEADEKALAALRGLSAPGHPVMLAENLPLPQVAALLAAADLFLGHDSGISHLAAAVGAPCVLLFGPTDPDIWAPPCPAVTILRPASGVVRDLDIAAVQEAVRVCFARERRDRIGSPA
jgi:heptosyltransferase-3